MPEKPNLMSETQNEKQEKPQREQKERRNNRPNRVHVKIEIEPIPNP